MPLGAQAGCQACPGAPAGAKARVSQPTELCRPAGASHRPCKGWTVLWCWTWVWRTHGVRSAGRGARPDGNPGNRLSFGPRDSVVALSPDPLTQNSRVPLIRCGLGLRSLRQEKWGLSFLCQRVWGVSAWSAARVGAPPPASPPPPVTSLSCCPSGLQHNRIWEVGADTFRQLSSLRAL